MPAARPSLDDYFRRPIRVPGLEGHPVVAFVDWTLRGIGQVVFQGNWLTGAIILAAIFVNSWVYGVACAAGAAVSTLTAMALRADRAAVRDGLFGFNGALVAIGLTAYLGDDFSGGELPGWRAMVFIVFGAGVGAVAVPAVSRLVEPYRLPGLTAPFVVTTWLFVFGVSRFGELGQRPLLTSGLPGVFDGTSDYTWTTWRDGIGKGVGEIFFQDNAVTGYLVLAAILVNSRAAALLALAGTVAGTVSAMFLGADEVAVRQGLFGFNAALTAIALGATFAAFSLRTAAYAIAGAVVSALAWASFAVGLAPPGMPTLTAPFVAVTWLFLLARDGFGAFAAPVDPEAA